MKQTNKAFSLVELLVVIAIIGLLSTIIIVSFTGIRQSAISAKGKSNQHTANVYCTMYPGVSYPNGDQTQPVYCDNNSVMWSPTLTIDGAAKAYAWGPETCLPTYAKGNCNNLKDKDIVDYPACQACRNLDYAGFSEGWKLPTQSNGNLVTTSGCEYCCNTACAMDGSYCAPGRQLWDFGAENCPNWKPDVCASSQGSCKPSYDSKAMSDFYWSSTQYSATSARNVYFTNGFVNTYTKSSGRYVRCVLGN